MKKITEFTQNNNIVFGFNGFDEWEDFIKIMNIIKDVLVPDRIKYQGIIDMTGYFEKEGIQVQIKFSPMCGNDIILSKVKNEKEIQKVREWVKTIFNNLVAEG